MPQDGVTALHLACKGGHANTVALLVQAGAWPQEEDARGNTPLSLAAKAADKVRTAIRSTTFDGAAESQPNGRITVSIGMAGWPMHGRTAPDLIQAADTALYAAKKAGRDQVKMVDGATS